MTISIVNVRGMNKPEQRAGVIYVGRQFAGWPGHPLGNPFKGPGALTKYTDWLIDRATLEEDLKQLWETTKCGELPLGCWCVSGIAGFNQPIVCHAQILGEFLLKRYGHGEA